jgi:hypothetical protein
VRIAGRIPPRCGCTHDEEQHHPAGRCLAALPPFYEEELPEWRCPCRRFDSPEHLGCPTHRAYWHPDCAGCADKRTAVLALVAARSTTVQSRTVHAADLRIPPPLVRWGA